METVLLRISSEIEKRRADMISFLRALVREPSELGNERSAQEIVHAKWQALGLDSRMWELDPVLLASHSAFAPVEWGYRNRPNVTAVLRSPAGDGRSIILNGHIDVVSPEPLSHWAHDPWGGEVEGNRLYGRGAADMKGGIAMMALAVEGIRASGTHLRGDVILETVIEEECSGNGTLACRLAGWSADAAVVCEPYCLMANIATMGVMWFRVTVRGRGGHVARAHEGASAIEKCFPLIASLRQMETEMNAAITHELFRDLEHPVNFNVGKIRGGHWPSSIPTECSFECRLSYPPDVDPEEVRKQVEMRLAEEAGKSPWLSESPPTVACFGFRADGSEVDLQTEIVRGLAASHRQVLQKDLAFNVSRACDDARYFNRYFQTPTVGYGPVGGGQHGVDEWVDLDSIVVGAKVLAHLILDWCGVVT